MRYILLILIWLFGRLFMEYFFMSFAYMKARTYVFKNLTWLPVFFFSLEYNLSIAIIFDVTSLRILHPTISFLSLLLALPALSLLTSNLPWFELLLPPHHCYYFQYTTSRNSNTMCDITYTSPNLPMMLSLFLGKFLHQHFLLTKKIRPSS